MGKTILLFNGKHLSLVYTYIRMFKVLLAFALIFVPPPTTGDQRGLSLRIEDTRDDDVAEPPAEPDAAPPPFLGPPARFLPQQQQRFQQQQQRFQQQEQGGPPARFLPQQQQRF